MATTGTKTFKFSAQYGPDDIALNGVLQNISVRYQCICFMKEYEHKSMDELRWEDYLARSRRPQQISGGLFASNDSITSNPFGLSNPPHNWNSNSLTSIGRTFLFAKPDPPFGNTNAASSFGHNPPPVNNSSFFSSCTRSNFAVFDSSNKNPFKFPEKMSDFGSTNIFQSGESKPVFGIQNAFGQNDSNPCFGSKGLFTVPGTANYTPTASKNSLFNLSQMPARNLRNVRVAVQKHGQKRFLPEEIVNSKSNDAENASNDGVKVLVAGIGKFNFSSNKSVAPGPQGDNGWEIGDFDNVKEEMKKIVTELQGLIECPVCFGSLDSSLKQCESGHGICGSCFENIKECPTCQRACLPLKPILLSQILERLPQLCLFTEKGCDQIFFSTSKKEEHEIFCRFRPVSCKFESCVWKGTVEDITDHVRICKSFCSKEHSLHEIHFPNVKTTSFYKFDKTQNASFCSAVIFENKLFWKYFLWDSSAKMMSHKFVLVSQSEPKQKYYLVVSFSKGDIEFKMCIAASYETEEPLGDEKGNEAAFYFPDSELERFYNPKTKGYCYTQHIVVEDLDEKK